MCPGGTGYPCRCGALRGAQGGGRLLILPLAFLFAPYPPSPLPRWGRGRPKVYFAGGFAPGTPALDRLRHLQPLPSGHPGGRTRAALAIPAAVVPGGGLALFAVRLPCLYLLFCPLSPRPRSQSALPQRGRGRIKVFLCKGLRPLHPRGLLRAALARRASAVPCGGAQGMVVGSPCPPMFPAGTCLSPRLPTLLLALFLPPIPPAPFPGGEGGAPKFISPGASPPAPLH